MVKGKNPGAFNSAQSKHGKPMLGVRVITVPNTQQVFWQGKSENPAMDEQCPSCKFYVPLRKNGMRVGHKVGTRRDNSYPCPNGDKGIL